MKHTCSINIYFDYGGYYSDDGNDIQWNRKEDQLYNLVIKDEINYFELVTRLCKKIKVDETTMSLKLSYIPSPTNPKRPVYIFDDEGVFGYLVALKKDEGTILHVEFIESVSENQSCENFPKDNEGSRVVVTNVEHDSEVRENDLIIAANTELEPLEQGDMLENVPHITYSENDPLEECANVDNNGTSENAEVLSLKWEDGINLTLGQEFENKQLVQDLVEKAVHRNCFEFATIKSTPNLYVLKCRDVDCKWSLRVAKLKNSNCLSVRTYNKMHTCSRITTSTRKNRRKGTPRLVASILHEDYPGKFDTPTPKTLIDMVQGRIGVKVSYSTALRGKKQAASDIRGSSTESFKMLPSYLYMLELMNPGTVTHVEVDEENKFKYLFFALGACIEGFKAMRKVIIVDGTSLKTLQGGVLIVATCQDPDRHHYPIAFGVVDGEKDASWRWFFNMLKRVVPDNPELVFISDRHASIIKTIGEIYPLSKHGYCIFHLSQNVKSHVSGVNKEFVAQKFRECAQVYTEIEFHKLYTNFRQIYPSAATYLDISVGENKWARCYFPGERYNIDTTNCAESINGVFREARKYSLLPMIDAIISKMSEWFNKHRRTSGEVLETQKLVPYVAHELHVRCQEAKLLVVNELNSFMLEYSVVGRDGKLYMVDLIRKTCNCKCFDIDRYPCVHAIAAAISYSKTGREEIHLHDLCSKYYWMEQWSLAYYRTIYPVLHKSDWNIPENILGIKILPPDYIKRKGRIQETRFPSVGEHR